MKSSARREHYARPRTAPDMHHDASYEVASSAEVIQGRTARSRPSATRVHSPGRKKGVTVKVLSIVYTSTLYLPVSGSGIWEKDLI